MKLIKTIEVAPSIRPDGIYFDAFNERVYVFSHPTKDATVIDAKSGAELGTVDLGGTPEQGVGDGKGCSTSSCRICRAVSRRWT
ncbi:MAG: hypothetical protein ABSH56_03435 [Bryobacteraceae bacterium]|jgi:DNA-binding beta-propeller fold protein YncE